MKERSVNGDKLNTQTLTVFFQHYRYYNSKMKRAPMGLWSSDVPEKVENYIILEDEILIPPEARDMAMSNFSVWFQPPPLPPQT